MSVELKPCPFCGGEAEALSFAALSPTIHGATSVVCTECAAGIEVDTAELWLHDAAWYWNSRAERTCRIEWEKHSDWFRCDACGKSSHVERDDSCLGYISIEPFFCPNCGAKVVE